MLAFDTDINKISDIIPDSWTGGIGGPKVLAPPWSRQCGRHVGWWRERERGTPTRASATFPEKLAITDSLASTSS